MSLLLCRHPPLKRRQHQRQRNLLIPHLEHNQNLLPLQQKKRPAVFPLKPLQQKRRKKRQNPPSGVWISPLRKNQKKKRNQNGTYVLSLPKKNLHFHLKKRKRLPRVKSPPVLK